MSAAKKVLLREIESLSDEEAMRLLEFLHPLKSKINSKKMEKV